MAMIRKATDGSRPSVSAKERYVHNFYSTSVSFSPARRSLAHNISFERRAGDKERNEAGISAARYHLLGHETKRYDVLELRHMIHVRYGVSLVCHWCRYCTQKAAGCAVREICSKATTY